MMKIYAYFPSRLVEYSLLLLLAGFQGSLWAATATASSSSCSTSGSGQGWSNAAQVVASDNSYATVSVNDGQVSNNLQCTGYGFAIHAAATITGVTVKVENRVSNTNAADYAVRLIKGGVVGATDRSSTDNYPVSDSASNDAV